MYIMPNTCQIPSLGNIMEKYLGAKRNGFFVDVGAHDGMSWSNVWGLAEAGWSGLCYEPDTTLAAACIRNHYQNKHHGVYTVQQAVGATDGWLDLWTSCTDLPTTDADTVRKLSANHNYVNSGIRVRSCKLDTSLKEWNAPVGFDVLSVDVEGGEWDVIQGFTLELWRPKMAIIEMHSGIHWEPGRGLHNDDIANYFKPSYDLVHSDGLNNIYVER